MMGLLKKASLLSEVEMPDFFSLCKNKKVSHYIKLQKFEDRYFAVESFGLDYDSIIKSYSTSDFWNGTITEEGKSFSFENHNYNSNPLLQFFSQKIQKQINFINVIKYSDSIVINCDSPSIQFEYAEKDKFNFCSSNDLTYFNKYKLNFNELLNNLVITNINIDIDVQKKVFFGEIKNRILQAFSSLDSIIKFDDFCVELYLAPSLSDSRHIETHLNLTLKDFFDSLNFVDLEYIGKVLASEKI